MKIPHKMIMKIKDIISLCKPRITMMVLFTAMGGFYLAQQNNSIKTLFFFLLGLALLVGGANALNMYLERDTDAKMTRTKDRPLPAGRLTPNFVLFFGLFLGVISVTWLIFTVNTLTGFLGFLSFIIYVIIYTPMKQRSSLAVLVGAIPGAMPPLMGFTAATGTLSLGGLVLFGILFFWQVPHFLAITLYREKEFTSAGYKLLLSRLQRKGIYHQMALYTAALWGISLLPFLYHITGLFYFVVAFIVGCFFFLQAVYGVFQSDFERWARHFFFGSLLYLVVLFSGITLDRFVS